MSERSVENILADPRKAMLLMAVPLMLSMAVGELQVVMDTYWCSSLSSDELSAIAICRPVYSLMLCIGAGTAVGASAAVAKAIGAGDRDSAEALLTQTVMLILAVSVLSSLSMFVLRGPLIDYISGGSNADICMGYMVPYLLLTFPIMMHNVFAGLLRAEGASRKAMMLSILAAVFNMVLDPLFIFGFGMGVSGASAATALSFLLTTLIGFRWYLSGGNYLGFRKPSRVFDRLLLAEISVIGLPCVIEMAVSPMLMTVQNSIVVSCGGTDGLVVYLNAFNLVALAVIPVMALADTVIPVISAELGEGRPDKIGECCRYTYLLNISIALVLSVIMFVFADPIAGIYSNSESMAALHPMFVEAMRIYVFTILFYTVLKTGNSMIRALRYAKVTVVLTFARDLLFIMTYYIAAGISMTAVFWAVDVTNCIMMCATLSVLAFVFRRYGIGFFGKKAVAV